jgi:hypothetical protein
MYLNSINKELSFNGAIEAKDLKGINLSLLSDEDLELVYSEAVGYAENLVEFEMEGRHE